LERQVNWDLSLELSSFPITNVFVQHSTRGEQQSVKRWAGIQRPAIKLWMVLTSNICSMDASTLAALPLPYGHVSSRPTNFMDLLRDDAYDVQTPQMHFWYMICAIDGLPSSCVGWVNAVLRHPNRIGTLFSLSISGILLDFSFDRWIQ